MSNAITSPSRCPFCNVAQDLTLAVNVFSIALRAALPVAEGYLSSSQAVRSEHLRV
jgi:hypothetical protein